MSSTLPAPGAAEDFTVRSVTRADVGTWHHVFNTLAYPATTAARFARGWGHTRFAPIAQNNGRPMHTYFVASNAEAAYMESVLHDVTLSPPGVFEVDQLRHSFLAQVELPQSLHCVSFHTHDLPRLQGITRANLIDSPAVCYPYTRAWAQPPFFNDRMRKPLRMDRGATMPRAV